MRHRAPALRGLRTVAALAATLGALCAAPRLAVAQPVSFQLKNDVPAGARPSITLSAVEKVADIRIALQRDDGASFEIRHAGLAPGGMVTLPVGDGAPGKARYTGRLTLTIVGVEPWSYDLAFETLVRAGMTLKYDFEHLDLPGRTLRFQQSRPAGKAEIIVIAEDGSVIGHGDARYGKEPAGTWLPIQWTQDKPGRVLLLRLHAIAADGLGAQAELIPWSVQVPHEDVNFETDSAVIKPGEAGKLDASLDKIRQIAKGAEPFLQVKLYVAGHTDTVGSKDHNRQLSLGRARAIAEYFRRKGLKLPITYEGFGEEVPAVSTADSVDEPRNRRVDYVLGAANASPPFGGRYSGVRTDWKPLK